MNLYSETFPILCLFLFFNTLHWNILQLLIWLQDRIQLGKKESIINKSSKKYFYCAYNTEISFKGTYQMSDKYCNALFVFFLLVFTPLMIEKEMAY